ncbi:MDR family MFS transporter [Streptomyces sp. NPDC048337]|uniref:MDR family MFS transporter n=1 Tax=Streptomyces sp. NPDC048337 TaxID=3365535 RepID=UPI003715D028
MDQLIAGDPARIGPYRLIARLGAGGMGLVYLGRSEGGRTVAVKVVQAEHAGHPEFRSRFAREVAAARRVGGSWTADVLDADPEAAVPWVATQYIPGPDLQTVVAQDFGPLPEHSVHTLANRLALALQAVHEAGLIHRDLKPSNVLVTVDGPRVIDFGIARAMDSLGGDSLHTRTGMLIGSPGFMSPEQARGLELTPASDVFCLGAVLVYAATGRMLFGATDTGLNAHLFRVAEEEADLTGVPEPLVDLVRACLDKDPAKRPTPREIAARTATDQAAEWLPGVVLAQLGRHAAQLLDFAPEPPAGPSLEKAAAPQPDPRVAPLAQPQPLPPPPPAYAPTAPVYSAPGQGFGPPPVTDSPHPRRWWGLAVIALAQLMVLLEATNFSVAAPSIQADLHMDSGGLSWMLRVYVFTFGCLLLIGGRLADRVGHRLALIIGLAGCAGASAVAGSAGAPVVLITARAFQGVFAALVTPSALALVVGGFTDPGERRRAFGIYAAIAGGGSAFALLVGGWLLEFLGWRGFLYGGTLIAVIALIGAITLLRDRPGPTGVGLDVLGLVWMLLGTTGLAAVIYGLSEADRRGWTDLVILVLLVAGAGLLGGFLWAYARTPGPSGPPSTVRGRDRVGGVLALFLAGVGAATAFSALVFYLQSVLGYSPLSIGLAFVPLAATVVIGSTQVSARMLHRVAPRVLIVAGLVVAALGLLLLTGLEPHGTYMAHVLPGMLLTGFGIGLAFMPVFATATDGAAPQYSGAVSATVTVAQNLGGLIGAVLLSSAITARLSRDGEWISGPILSAVLPGHTDTLWWGIGALLLGGLLAGLLITTKAPQGAPAPVHKASW